MSTTKKSRKFEEILSMLKDRLMPDDEWREEYDKLSDIHKKDELKIANLFLELEAAKEFVLELEKLVINEQYEDLLLKISKFKQKNKIQL